jgi:DNA-binding beta-propeller fold protein YncE
VVRLYDLTGKQLGALGQLDQPGKAQGQLNGPRALALDAAGHLHVLDAGNRRVVVFSSQGAWLRTYGGRSQGAGHLVYPRMIRPDGTGRLVVADAGAERLVAYTPDGRFVEAWQPKLANGKPARPLRLSRGPNGGLAVCAQAIKR